MKLINHTVNWIALEKVDILKGKTKNLNETLSIIRRRETRACN
jgi:hypothetical protein